MGVAQGVAAACTGLRFSHLEPPPHNLPGLTARHRGHLSDGAGAAAAWMRQARLLEGLVTPGAQV